MGFGYQGGSTGSNAPASVANTIKNHITSHQALPDWVYYKLAHEKWKKFHPIRGWAIYAWNTGTLFWALINLDLAANLVWAGQTWYQVWSDNINPLSMSDNLTHFWRFLFYAIPPFVHLYSGALFASGNRQPHNWVINNPVLGLFYGFVGAWTITYCKGMLWATFFLAIFGPLCLVASKWYYRWVLYECKEEVEKMIGSVEPERSRNIAIHCSRAFGEGKKYSHGWLDSLLAGFPAFLEIWAFSQAADIWAAYYTSSGQPGMGFAYVFAGAYSFISIYGFFNIALDTFWNCDTWYGFWGAFYFFSLKVGISVFPVNGAWGVGNLAVAMAFVAFAMAGFAFGSNLLKVQALKEAGHAEYEVFTKPGHLATFEASTVG